MAWMRNTLTKGSKIFQDLQALHIKQNALIDRGFASVCLHHRPDRYQKTGVLDVRIYQSRSMARGNFFSKVYENIKQEFDKNKEMKESVKKFREEADKLEKSEALEKIRQKYQEMDKEKSEIFESLTQKLEEAKQTESVKKLTEEVSKHAEKIGEVAGKVSETVGRGSEQLGKIGPIKNIKEGVGTISSEFQKSTIIYEAPVELRKRSDYLVNNPEDEKIIAPDEESTGMVMHKDSRWSQSWQNFKDSNQYVHKLFDLKTKYDESDHLAVRMTRAFTDRIGSVFGGMLQPTKMSEVLTEIEKMDPTFEKEKFLQQCRQDLVPNVLESWVRGDLEILQDWCYEAAFNVLGQPVQQNLAMGLKSQCKVLDISPVELAAGQLMEQGPVLIISFSTQQVEAWVDKSNKVVSGDPDKLLKVVHVWALCRDQSILDPRAAWRVLEFSFHPTEQLF